MASATLIVLGDALDPEMVTKALKLQPSKQWKKGERKSHTLKDGTVKYFDSYYEWGGWKRWGTDKDRKKNLITQIEQWCKILSGRKSELARLHARGNTLFIDCCIVGETGSIAVPPQLHAKLADLHLTLEITFYSYTDDDEKRSNQSLQLTARPRRARGS